MRVAILGLGLSGLGAVKLALYNKFITTGIDKKRIAELSKDATILTKKGMTFVEEKYSHKILKEIDLLVVSPGIPKDNKIIKLAKSLGIKTISEIEFAYYHCKGKIIAITGSNGKTTTTSMIFSILKSYFKDVRLAGNIGIAFSDKVIGSKDETIFVLELSSFQLENIEKFKADTAVLLNLTPDHQDQYNSFEDYCLAKINVFNNQTKSDFAIINRFDKAIDKYKNLIKAKKFYFSSVSHTRKGTFIKKDSVYFLGGKDQLFKLFSINKLKVRGPHNLENAMAAASAAFLNGVPPQIIESALNSFNPLPHRLEYVTTINGADFYNDSKATNTDSVLKALKSFEKNVVLLLGGKDKGADFSDLEVEVLKRCKKVVCFGEAREKIKKTFSNKIFVECYPTLKKAVSALIASSTNKDIVLLSPACASFDEFKNFEDRGEKYKEWVIKGKK